MTTTQWLFAPTVKHLFDLGEKNSGMAEREFEATYEHLERYIADNLIVRVKDPRDITVYFTDKVTLIVGGEWGRTISLSYTDNERLDAIADRLIRAFNYEVKKEIPREMEELLREMRE